jgi:23S rRNA (uracil1939-C5)-methyltransferase
MDAVGRVHFLEIPAEGLMAFELVIEKLIYGGNGLGRVNGRVVLAPYVLPGERIRAETEREKPGLVHARTLEVLDPAFGRVSPPCPYFGRCGGCQYQHASYEEQLRAKQAILAEELRRVGKIEAFPPVEVIAGEPWSYRNRVQLHFENGRLGYREARSHKLCAIDHCPISSPKINQTIGILNGMLHDSRWPHFVRSLEIFTDEQQVQLNIVDTARPVGRRFFEWCAEAIPGFVAGALDYVGRFRVSGNAFFQVNRLLLDELVSATIDGATGESAVDLYAGVGPFALALSEWFGQVTAVESGAAAVRDLRFNAERAGRTNVRAEQKTTEAYLEGLEKAPDLVLLDPPRAGLGKNVVRRLGELCPPAITIVACDPATLARDLAGLITAGYRIEKLTLIDLFPQTYHLETVVRLLR